MSIDVGEQWSKGLVAVWGSDVVSWVCRGAEAEDLQRWLDVLRKQPLSTKARELAVQGTPRQKKALKLMEPDERESIVNEIDTLLNRTEESVGSLNALGGETGGFGVPGVVRGTVVEPDLDDILSLTQVGYTRDQAWFISLVHTYASLGYPLARAQELAFSSLFRPAAADKGHFNEAFAAATPPSVPFGTMKWGIVPPSSNDEVGSVSAFVRLRRQADQNDLRVARGDFASERAAPISRPRPERSLQVMFVCYSCIAPFMQRVSYVDGANIALFTQRVREPREAP